MPGKIKGKQVEDLSVSLNKLSGAGNVQIASASQFQIVGSSSSPNDVVSRKDLDQALSGFTGGDGRISVKDYNTGVTFSNIETIVFRGNTVTVPGGTATGVLADNNPNPNTVTVWIPAPDYVDYFNQGGNAISNVGTTSRKISDGLGTYNQGSYTAGSTQPTINSGQLGQLSYSVTEFSVFDNINSELYLTLYDADGSTIIESITYSLTGVGSTSSNGLTINVTQLDPDNDRYKASVLFTADLTNAGLIPLGGKFTIRMEHNNIGDSSYSSVPKTQTAFYDRDTDDGNTSTAVINGSATLQEKNANEVYLSGVAYYDTGSSFTASVTNMDNLNEITYPTGTQLNIDFSNSLGIPDVNVAAGGSGYVGWTNAYNTSNVDYINDHNITSTNLSHPGLDNNNNLNSSSANFSGNIYDWILVDTQTSINYQYLIWIKTTVSDRNEEDFVTEDNRLSVWNLVSGGVETTFDSQIDLTNAGTYSYELQQTFGRLVYPKIDFSTWFPQYNIDNSIVYTSAATQSLSIPVVTGFDLTSGVTSTASQTYNEYRWYLRKFETTGIADTMGNGTWVFNTDFAESDLLTQNDGTSGNGNFLVFMDINNNTIPNRWFDLSKSPINNGPRANATGAGSSNLDDNGEIAWNTGSGVTNGYTAWLLIGIKNTSTSKEVTNIQIQDGNWD